MVYFFLMFQLVLDVLYRARDSVGPDMVQTCAAGRGDRRKGEQPFYVKDYAERAALRHVRRLLPSRSAPTAVVQAAAAPRSLTSEA
ncbi:hypothetical protein NDU88_008207 [Pleurodeles waltl]|uniref:Secreted protein n=1 Tax=Pleurodeles waltl TaxID=8319 RepID=A0AAV7RV39_PLEWA|nr:hypothetical protein NDU88_008207 [Pleurodeles waltl]